MRSRALRRVGQGTVVLLLAGAFASTGGSAQAEAPVAQGWWTVTNVKDSLPVTPPDLPIDIPPDVPPDGLLVQGGPTEDQPTAFSALVYDLDEGMTPGKLVLTVAPSSASSPASTLRLCRLADSGLSSQQGGAMAGAPKYDCTGAVEAGPSGDGKTYTFDAGKLADGGTLAVAILPAMATDRVVLSRPDASSLTASTSTVGGTSAPPAFDESAPPADSSGVAQPPALQSGGTTDVPALAAADVPGPSVAAPAEAPAPAVASQQPVALAPAAASTDAGGHGKRTGLLLLAALAVAAVLWSTAGNSPLEGSESHA